MRVDGLGLVRANSGWMMDEEEGYGECRNSLEM
jgi:hypothetical protein